MLKKMNEMGGQKITVQKRTGEENIFENFKEVNQKTSGKSD